MRFLALACDYDGTLATNGQVDATTVTALERLLVYETVPLAAVKITKRLVILAREQLCLADCSSL